MPEAPSTQLAHLRRDLRSLTRGRWSRLVPVVFGEAIAIVAFYRLNRAAYLALGRGWSAVRALLAPLNPLIRIFVSSEIDYRADLGPGLRILHPQLGVVVGSGVIAGSDLILAGGNTLGDGSPHLGDHVELGVNAVVAGDVTLGDRVVIGAGAVVVHDFAGPGVLVGVPARPV
jgi:serine acetyltransferase